VHFGWLKKVLVRTRSTGRCCGFGFFFFHIFDESTFMRDCRILAWDFFIFIFIFFFTFSFHSLTELEGVRTGWLAGAFGVSSFTLSLNLVLTLGSKLLFFLSLLIPFFSFFFFNDFYDCPSLLLLLPPLSFYVRSFLPACRSFWCPV